MNLQYLFLSVLAVVLIGALFALVVVPILHSWPASYPFPQPRISTSSSPTIRPRDGKLLTEYVSPYGYRFFYPRNYRLAPIFAILLSRTERRDDVVFVTTASKDQESDYVSANRAAGNGGINCSNDIGSRDFLRTGVLIQPGAPGEVSFVGAHSSKAARDSDLKTLGYIVNDYEDLRDLTSTDRTQGLLFTVTSHKSATDTQSLPCLEAVYPLEKEGVFPSWELINFNESSTIQITIPSDAPETTKSAFKTITETISFF